MLYGVLQRVLNWPTTVRLQVSAKLTKLDEEHNIVKKQCRVAEESIQKLQADVTKGHEDHTRTQVIRFEIRYLRLSHCSFANYDSFVQNN